MRVRIDGVPGRAAARAAAGPPLLPPQLAAAASQLATRSALPGGGAAARGDRGAGAARRGRRALVRDLADRRHLLPRRPSPDAEPYVKVGDLVHKGQVLCIVEAMKLMNEIEADVSGTIVQAATPRTPSRSSSESGCSRSGRPEPAMISKVLIANRGEIALRIIAACREAGPGDGGRPLGGRPRLAARAHGRRVGVHRAGLRQRVVPQHHGGDRRGRDHRRRRDPPRLRLPRRERALRRGRAGVRPDLDRAAARGDPR